MRKKWLPIILYSLPILFFVVSYFVMTVSGEDIWQGAGNWRNNVAIDVVADAKEAFEHNGRLTDMYAWTAIDFFDYQFNFGLDTIFRLLDVVMAGGVFYLMSVMVLGRKLKIEVKDALLFDVSFAGVMLTQHGRVFYAGFSAIHNYMIAIFIMLLFGLPYVMKMWGKRVEMRWWGNLLFLLLGVVFGMSAAVPPVAFVIVWVASVIVRWRKKIRAERWEICGFSGVLVGLLLSNFLGPSLDFYTTNDVYTVTYDYISVQGFLADFASGIVRIFKHLVVNFGRVLVPLVAFGIVAFVFIKKSRQIFSKQYWIEMVGAQKRVLLAIVGFGTLCVLGTFQVSAPLRVLLPAYIVGLIALIIIARSLVPRARVLGCLIVIMASGILITRLVLAVNYHIRMAAVLENIRDYGGATMCIEQEDVKAVNLPVVYLGQEDMLADWAMPEVIYDKTIEFCQ